MIKHIVCWKLKDAGADTAANAQKIKSLLEALNGKIDGLRKIEVGINAPGTSASNWSLVLYSEFDSLSDLNFYQEHPEHIKAATFVRSVIESRVCVDYEI